MATTKTDIFVYAAWQALEIPQLIGVLSAHAGKGHQAFSFTYDKDWLAGAQNVLLDPDLGFYSGPQFPNDKANFGVFLDSMPDTWGRTLIKRRAAQQPLAAGQKARTLTDLDFLLGVYDESRVGALRFKLDPSGPFLDSNTETPTPPWSSIRELQYAAERLEQDIETEEIRKWLAILIAPGSSLGGARPKANLLDEHQALWIAKFPAKNDTIDKGAWEYLAYRLALKAGILMSESRLEKILGSYHTFLTKRFDRNGPHRIHFSSAMTMTGNNEDTLKTRSASYLDIAEFISNFGVNVEANLHQLWRRIVFNIAVSNTDDHLRNHGFILTPAGWELSPAYDINPSIEKSGLAINIDLDNNTLNLELAKQVGEYFRLTNSEMAQIISEVKNSVMQWPHLAEEIGIPRSERELMRAAFLWG